ncbi:GNAT family N-acetyltransferase [Nocardioides cheoyonin]|uniref:GNAT family N-acetyltransferase n=1 Tax=Nocardioides cheoyonin TaxID=3156615 RepID=UPI0032B4B70C
MSRRILPLTLDRFAELSAPCRSCLFWELDPVRLRHVPPERAVAEKEAWISEVLREWGSCGRVAVVDGETVGFLIYVPPSYAGGAGSFPTAPVSPDAVLLTTVWIDPRHAGGGLGRMLVQGMARDLIGRPDVRAVEAFGDVGPISGIHGRRCAAPAEFLARVGFKTHRAHVTAPRLRMELKAAVSWREEVEVAWERLWGVVRPRRHRAPAPVPVHHQPSPVRREEGPKSTPPHHRPGPVAGR